ncbi:MAG: hypothetical protein AAF431_16185 [Pseudomonadota bacterium]
MKYQAGMQSVRDLPVFFRSSVILLLGLLVTTHCHAIEPGNAHLEPLRVNSLDNLGAGQFTVSGNDPYLVLAVEDQTSEDVVARDLVLAIKVNRDDNDVRDIPLEIFYRSAPSAADANAILFDPLYRIQFSIPSTSDDSAAAEDTLIRLPVSAEMLPLARQLRLDIDSCRRCSIELMAMPVLDSSGPEQNSGSQPSQDASQLDDQATSYQNLRIINGARAIPESGLDVDDSAWTLNDLQAIGAFAMVSGNDPFLVSPIIDAAIDDLAGLLIEIDAPNGNQPNFDFQLFYATEKHNFIESASSYIRVGSKADGAPLLFFVPLGFLSTQAPSVKLLKRLRLDIANPVETSEEQIWSPPKIALVSKLESANYQDLIPGQLIHNKLQRSSKRQLLIDILARFGEDIIFSIFYVLLLAGVVTITMRKFRSNQ